MFSAGFGGFNSDKVAMEPAGSLGIIFDSSFGGGGGGCPKYVFRLFRLHLLHSDLSIHSGQPTWDQKVESPHIAARDLGPQASLSRNPKKPLDPKP